jgi:PAS domain S-box-containing protein
MLQAGLMMRDHSWRFLPKVTGVDPGIGDFKMNLFTLTFPHHLEGPFREEYFRKSVGHVRFAFLIAILFYSFFGILDAWLVPEVKQQLWIIRYVVFAPLAFGAFLFSFLPSFKRYMEVSIAAVLMTAGVGIIVMILIAPSPGKYFYYAGLILVLIYCYTFFKLRFIWASAVGWLTVILYEIAAVGIGETPLPILVNNNFFFISSNVLGMFACYSAELNARREFMQARRIEVEKKKVDRANRKLEKRVQERTAQLVHANSELKQEIGERALIEEALRASEERYRTIIESIEEGYFEIDLKGNMVFFNDATCNILGFSREELQGMNNREYADPETSKRMFEMFNEVYRTGNPSRILDYEIFKKDGSRAFVEISAKLMRSPSGQPIGFRGIARDVSERKKAEVQLQQSKEAAEKANQAKSEFLANMSHELRTPLNHIIGFTELVVDRRLGGLNEKQEEYLGDVLESSKHLLSLINDILDLSRVEAGKEQLELSDVNVTELLEGSLFMIRERSMKHGIHLCMDRDGVPEEICADERKLKQILYNLLSNAVKFTPDGGSIQLNARLVSPPEADPSRFVEFSVSDTGIGIPPQNLERIFGRFEQGEVSISRRYQGTGLGLSLSRGFVELHGGRIWAESEGEGRGATLRFRIPV